MSGIRCGLFKPGHNPHWIQMSKASQDVDHPPAPGRLLEVHDDGTFLIVIGEAEHRFWNHQLARVADAIAAADGRLAYQEQWGLLWVPSDVGRFAFCLASPSKRVACLEEAPSGTPAELLQRNGGFTLRVEDVKGTLLEGHS